MGAKYSKSNWQPDNSQTTCMGCGAAFSVTVRRHHCRECGGLFCGACSNRRAQVPSLKVDAAVRVCKTCFENISGSEAGSSPVADRQKPSVAPHRDSSLVHHPAAPTPTTTVTEHPTGAVLTNDYATVVERGNRKYIDITSAAITTVTNAEESQATDATYEFGIGCEDPLLFSVPLPRATAQSVADLAALLGAASAAASGKIFSPPEKDMAALADFVDSIRRPKFAPLLTDLSDV